MTPADLLDAARDLLERPAAADIGAWPRAVAVPPGRPSSRHSTSSGVRTG